MSAATAIEQRIAACLTFEQESIKSGVRLEALRPLHYLFVTGLEIERGEFKRMTGLGDRTAVNLISALVRRGLLRSDTVQGKVHFGLSLHALRFGSRRCGRRPRRTRLRCSGHAARRAG